MKRISQKLWSFCVSGKTFNEIFKNTKFYKSYGEKLWYYDGKVKYITLNEISRCENFDFSDLLDTNGFKFENYMKKEDYKDLVYEIKIPNDEDTWIIIGRNNDFKSSSIIVTDNIWKSRW